MARGRWQEYLRRRVPPPSRLSFVRRGAWQAAYDRALAIGNSSEVRHALVVELWYCENPNDVANNAWSKIVAVSFADGSYDLAEKATIGDRIVLARLEQSRRGFIMPSRFYAPGVALPYRNAHYVAVEGRSIERVVAIERVAEGVGVSKPNRDVPPFSTDAEPGVKLDGVESDLAECIHRLVDKLRISPEVDGDSSP